MIGRRSSNKRTIESFFRRKENVEIEAVNAQVEFPVEANVEASSNSIQSQYLPTDANNFIHTEGNFYYLIFKCIHAHTSHIAFADDVQKF